MRRHVMYWMWHLRIERIMFNDQRKCEKQIFKNVFDVDYETHLNCETGFALV